MARAFSRSVTGAISPIIYSRNGIRIQDTYAYVNRCDYADMNRDELIKLIVYIYGSEFYHSEKQGMPELGIYDKIA